MSTETTQTHNRRKIFAANWKMNGSKTLIQQFTHIAKPQQNSELILAAPTGLIDHAYQMLSDGFALAGQDCHWEQEGAFTGETSPKLLKELGCHYVLIGHSERRVLMGETDEYMHDKLIAAFTAGLTPILCIGETLEQYKAQETFITLASQLYHGLPKIAEKKEMIIAYEPVWAIGTGLTPSCQEIQNAHDHIRTFLCSHWNATKGEGTHILYGGSAKPSNAAELMNLPDVDGLLVGGASLQADQWSEMIQY